MPSVYYRGDHAPVLPVKDSAPADSDYASAPPNGTMQVGNDGTNDAIYVRVNDAWVKVALA